MSNLLLLLTALIWGSAFVAQRLAAQTAGVFLFNGLRFLLGGLSLLPVLWLTRRAPAPGHPPASTAPAPASFWQALGWVFTGGALLFSAGGFQQAGLQYTTAGNAAFLTGMYVVFVPGLLWLLWRQRVPLAAWAAAFLAAAGALLLSAQGSLNLAPGDGLELAGAVLWAGHVIVVGRAVHRVEILRFSAGQFFIAGILNLVAGLFLEKDLLREVIRAWPAVVYTGVLSVGVGYTLQAVGQRRTSPAAASIILSMEAVFAALFGWLLLDERLVSIQLLGCALILAAIVLTVKEFDIHSVLN